MTTGVALLTYGSARDEADVPAYLSRVRQGRTPPDDLVAEFQRRYRLIGGSPLIPITRRLAAELERQLGEGFVVEAGMRFSDPTVAQAVERLVERGAGRVLGLILAPQYSPIIMKQYDQMLEAAAARAGVPWRMVGSWHLHPRFVGVLAERLRAGLDKFPADVRDRVPILMTAHSLPRRVVDQEPGYIDMLKATARAVAREAGLAEGRWHFAYQSAGHTPEEWLKPDMLEVLPELARAGHRHVLLAPVQFVADHLETLFDIDIGGKEQADEGGIEHFARVPAPNDSPEFAGALADVVRERLGDWPE
jgi:protoporphyrin/coproporphyrin ferrochelatase